MKSTRIIATILFLSNISFAGDCKKNSSLENIEELYQCVDEETSDNYCVQVGYHSSLEAKALIVEDKQHEQEFVFHNSPGEGKCYIYNPLDGCLHNELQLSSTEIEGTQWIGQDIVNSYSVETKFKINKNEKKARFSKLVYKREKVLFKKVREKNEVFLKCKNLI